MSTSTFSDFRPHLLLRSGHAQTLAAAFWPQRLRAYRAVQHRVPLDDDDQLVLHDDQPESWTPGGRTALLVHGLTGCHGSAYMRRIAERLNHRSVRTFRMDLRGCGAGVHLARLPYHSGRSADCARALEIIARICPGSPCTAIGFSLGANIVLKLLGECGDRPPGGLATGIAVCPPVDLLACSQRLQARQNRVYDRHFVAVLLAQLEERRRLLPDAPALGLACRPRTLYELDEQFTAPVWGFGTAKAYYECCSSGQFVPSIRLPTLILAARDDPLIPVESLERIALSPAVTLHITDHGGHLGFIGRRNGDPDRRWLDWRIVERAAD